MIIGTIQETHFVIKRGDITKERVDAIVNAANNSLLGGGGVDGAIHRAGGPKILEECKVIREQQGECPTGEAVITGGGDLSAEYVVHTVGPVWHGGEQGEAELLASAYRNSLLCAKKAGVKTIAFPSISTGAYSFPVDQAAPIALGTTTDFARDDNHFQEIRLILFNARDFEIYKTVWESLKVAG